MNLSELFSDALRALFARRKLHAPRKRRPRNPAGAKLLRRAYKAQHKQRGTYEQAAAWPGGRFGGGYIVVSWDEKTFPLTRTHTV